jgi:nitric oxide dioxygenase
VNWFHAAENGDVHAFADEVKTRWRRLPRLPRTSGIAPDEADRQAARFDSEGLMDLAAVADSYCDDMQFYLRPGGVYAVCSEAAGAGGEQDNIHYECFGPHKVL